MNHWALKSLLLLVPLLLIGCEDKKDRLEGDRKSLFAFSESLRVDPALKGRVVLPEPVPVAEWPLAGGNASHTMPRQTLSSFDKVLWSRQVGAAANPSQFFTSPVAGDGLIYVLDGDGVVSALDLKTGATVWQKSVINDDYRGKFLGGGVAYDQGVIYVSTSLGDLVALDAKTGAEKWQSRTNAPSRVSPTVVKGRVFVVTVDNHLEAYRAKTGERLWTHEGAPEVAGLIGGASPAYAAHTIVVAYSSGELFALRAENGMPFWVERLISRFHMAGYNTLNHVRARPIVDGSVVYTISNSGRMVALSFATGERLWEKDIPSARSPAISGDFLFVVTTTNDVLCLEKTTGRIAWRQELPSFEDPVDRKGRIFWAGPVLGGNWVIFSGSHKQAIALNILTGEIEKTISLPGKAMASPIIVNETVYFWMNSGELVAVA